MAKRKRKKDEDAKEIDVNEAYWKRLKDIIDAVMDSTQDDRDKMSDNLAQFQGHLYNKNNIKEEFGDDVPMAQINMFFSTVENIAPMLSDNKPITSVIPHVPYLSDVAWSYNAALKYVWETTDMQMNLYMAALCALVMKVAIFEVGYDNEKKDIGDVFCKVIDPRNFGLLPGYDEISGCPMVWVREPLPLSWIRKNFPDKKKVTPTQSLEKSEDKMKAFKYGEAQDFELEAFFAVVYRVWMKDQSTMVDIIRKGENGEDLLDEEGEPIKDKKQAYPHGKWCYFTENEWLGAVPVRDTHGRPPFVEMKNYLVPFQFLGMDENVQLEGVNKEINRQLQYTIDHAVRFHRSDYIVDAGQMTDTDDIKDNIGRGEGRVFFKNSTYENKGNPVDEVPHRPLDPTIVGLIDLLMEATEEITGVTEISKGQPGKKERQSATEIGTLAETAHTRTRQRVRNQDWTIENLSYLFIRMMQQYYTEDRNIWWKDFGEEDVKYDMFGSSKARVMEVMEDSIPDFEKVIGIYRSADNKAKEIPPNVLEQIEMYEQFIQNFSDTDDLDPVYFEFTIEVQTDSTLPLDRQSQSNLMLRLFEAKAIDVPLLLQTLQPKGWQQAVERWETAQEQKKIQQSAPNRGPIPMRRGG